MYCKQRASLAPRASALGAGAMGGLMITASEW